MTRRAKSFLAGLALFLATLLVFERARAAQFLPYDDDVYVTRHPFVPEGITSAGVRAAFLHGHGANWHPLTWLSHMLDVELFGLDPQGHHLTSVFLHASNALLVFLFLRRSTGKLFPSWIASALFALHPLRAESVAWVAERKDVLSGTFFALTLLAYLRYAERPGPARFALALLAAAAGLLSKATLVTLPFLLLLLDVWPLGRFASAGSSPRSIGRLFLEKLPFLAAALLVALLTYRAQAADRSVSSLAALPPGARIANALESYAAYLGQTLWPRDLATLYPHPGLLEPNAPPFDGAAILALVAVLALLGLARAGWKRSPWVSTGILWFLGMLVPVSGAIVQVGEQARADRYTYLPSIGISVAFVFAIERLVQSRRTRALAAALASGALVLLALRTRAEVRVWRDGVTLFEHATRVVPRNYLAFAHLGVAHAERGERHAARRAFEQALEIQPRYAEAWNNLGKLAADEGRPSEAIEHFERALQFEPDLAEAWNNLGASDGELGRLEEALVCFRRATELAPRHADAWLNLGLALLQLRRPGEAGAALRRAQELAPYDEEIARALALVRRQRE